MCIYISFCIYIYTFLEVYAYTAIDIHRFLDLETCILIVMQRHIAVQTNGYTHIRSKVYIWENIPICTLDISIYNINRNTDRDITSKLQQCIPYCYETVILLVYRRLNTEWNLSVSLQYQLPLDSSLRFVSQHGW